MAIDTDGAKKKQYSATSPDAEVDLRLEAEGPASWTPKTMFQVLEETVNKYPNEPALRRKKNKEDPDWETYTYTQYYEAILSFGKSLLSLGFQPHHAINIVGFNSPEWLIANSGCIHAGGLAAGVYPTNGPDACHYIANHSQAEVIVVENRKQLDKYIALLKRLPRVKCLVVWDFDGDAQQLEVARRASTVPLHTWDEFMKLGQHIPDSDILDRAKAQKPGQCSTLIYTSGTTGTPKAVMISHDNITWTARAFIEGSGLNFNHEDRGLSYLPLSHIAAQMLDIHMPIACGCCVYFAQPDAMRGSLTITMKEVKPTYFMGVPRVWEKMYEKLSSISSKTTGLAKWLGNWAKPLALEANLARQYGESGAVPWGYNLASLLVLGKVKAALGLDQCKIMVTGAAPISPEVLRYFASLDLPIMEVFGASECTGPSSSTFPHLYKMGTIGRDLPGVVSRSVGPSREYCLWGRHVMMGYMKMEDKTKEAIDDEGWLHTGDVADVDSDGFWKITGRIKELIITAGGENIPPVLIEDEFKKAMPAISNAMAVGDRQKFLSILLTLKTTINPEDGLPTNTLTKEVLAIGEGLGSSAKTVEEVMADPLWKAYIDKGTQQANKQATSNAQKIQKWSLLPVDFSEKGGELTPTLKLKRSVVAEKYADVIQAFYA